MRTLSILCALSLAGCIDDATESIEEHLASSNGLSTDTLVMNAILANDANNLRLGSIGLTAAADPSTPDGAAFRSVALNDPLARDVLGSWASCALSAGTSITLADGVAPDLVLRGSMGLCPSWDNYAPTTECQQSVSACMLARSNPTGARVDISLRGPTPNGHWVRNIPAGVIQFVYDDLPVQSPLKAGTESSAGVPVTSTVPCTTTRNGNRDCGWKPLYVGVSYVPVTLSAVNAGSAGDTMLRVCPGFAACDAASAIGFNDDTSSSERRPTVTFTPPANGVFSVMWAPYTSSDTTSTCNPTSTTSGAHYPYAEIYAFGQEEGALFGNLFLQPGQSLGWHVTYSAGGRTIAKPPTGTPTVFPGAYMCSAPYWIYNWTYAIERTCTSGACAVSYAGLCTDACASYKASDGSYRNCRGGGTTYAFPITTDLHGPCDVVNDVWTCGIR